MMHRANISLSVFSFALPIIGWIVSVTTDFGGRSMKELGKQDDYRIAPAKYAFWIWWLIYLLWGVRTVMAITGYRQSGFSLRTTAFAVACGICNFLYFPLVANGYRVTNLVFLSLYTVFAHAWLFSYHKDARDGDGEEPPHFVPKNHFTEIVWHFLTRQFLEIHAAWVLLATGLSALTYAVFSDSHTLIPNAARDIHGSGGLAITLAVFLIINLLMGLVTHGYAGTFTWFFIAVIVNDNIDYGEPLDTAIILAAASVFLSTVLSLTHETLHDYYTRCRGYIILASGVGPNLTR